MGTTNFVDKTTVIQADWLNDVDAGIYHASSGITGASDRTLLSKLSDIVSVKDFGGGPGIAAATNDAAFAAALAASNTVFVPPGTYDISVPIVLSSSIKALLGAGVGVTIINNTGTENAVEMKSAGGADPTKLYQYVGNMSITGNGSSGVGLYLYDTARGIAENLLISGHGSHGVLLEMSISNRLTNITSISNTGDGLRIADGVKSSVRFLSNANNVENPICNLNGGNGITLMRTRGNTVRGGDASVNDYGVYIDGGARNIVDGTWIENNTVGGIYVTTSTTPTTLAGDDNKIINVMQGGTGDIEIAAGTGNIVDNCYIAANLTISGGTSTIGTKIGRCSLTGTFTDGGSGTIVDLNATNQYIRASTAKRHSITVGSTVDFLSDIVAYRFGTVKGISGTTTQSNNLAGHVDIADAATSAAVTFRTAEADTSYRILMTARAITGVPDAGSTAPYMVSPTTGGFTVQLPVAPGSGKTIRVNWMLVR